MGVRVRNAERAKHAQLQRSNAKGKGRKPPKEAGSGGSVSHTGLELTLEEQRVVRDMEEETARSGRFKRIFPARNSYQYKKFFEAERPLNTMLANYCFSRGGELSGTAGGGGSIAMQQARDQRRREVQQRLDRGSQTNSAAAKLPSCA